jgi:hypothetical protein
MTLRVEYQEGRDGGSVLCEQVDEGDSGLYLLDGHGEQVGYIPFDSLYRVVPADR